MKPQLLCITLLIAFSSVQADIFRSVDDKGNPIFTDIPNSKNKPVKLKAPSTYQAPSLPTIGESSATDSDSDADASSYYETFSVRSPGDGEAFWDNAGEVNTSLSLEPALNVKAGHRVQNYVDGVAKGEPVASLSSVLHQVDRGEHSFYAVLINSAGDEITRTDTINFQVHRHTINSPAKKAKSGS